MARQTDRRRARLLKNLQIAILCLIAVGFAALLASRPNNGGMLAAYSWLILGLTVVMSVALALNLKGRYGFSAALTVGILTVPPWLSLAFDPRVLQGDFVPMAYVVFPVMIAAMFMGIRTVVTVAAVQDIGLFVLAAASPSTGFNWASLLTLIIVINVISTLYCLITREDLNQIDLYVESLNATQADLLYASTHDLLTGVYNRAYLAQQFPREISLASRNGRPFSIVMADIDRFKTINDTVGHAQGDEALRQVAQHLERMTRINDSVCRFGGDEFVLLLPDTDSLGAMTIAELVRTAMPGAGASGTEGATLTVSLGVATYRSHGSSPDEMLASVDASLYAAKRSGRNLSVCRAAAECSKHLSRCQVGACASLHGQVDPRHSGRIAGQQFRSGNGLRRESCSTTMFESTTPIAVGGSPCGTARATASMAVVRHTFVALLGPSSPACRVCRAICRDGAPTGHGQVQRGLARSSEIAHRDALILRNGSVLA